MDRLEERRQIAARLDSADAARSLVNNNPAVIAARDKADKARKEHDAAQAEFRRVFDEHYPCDDSIRRELVRKHPDLKLIGGGAEDDTSWIARCCVTGLPIFDGDKVIERGGEEDYQRTYVLAGSVSVDETLCLPPPNRDEQ